MDQNLTVHKIEISHRTIIFTVLFLFFCWFLYQIREILVVFFIGLILMSAFNPLVEKLEKLKIPRLISAIIVYVGIIGLIILTIASIIPPFISQAGAFISRFPQYFESIGWRGLSQNLPEAQISQLLDRLTSLSFGLVKITLGVFSNFLVVFILIVVSFYLILERKNLDRYFDRLFGSSHNQKAIAIFHRLEKRLGNWARAQFTLMLIVGSLCYLGLSLLGIEYALPLALLAGFLEIITNIGPVVAAIPGVIAGLAISPVTGLATAAMYFLVQQLENNLIVPQVMAKEVGVNPLITILSLAAGFKLGGIAGAVLAVPVFLLLETLVPEILTLRSKKT